MIVQLITYVRKTESDFLPLVIHIGLSEQMETFYLDTAY